MTEKRLHAPYLKQPLSKRRARKEARRQIDENGHSEVDRWIQEVLKYYIHFPEITKQLEVDGVPVFDAAGRPVPDDTAETFYGMRPGAVWITREMLQDFYDWQFGEGFLADAYKEHYDITAEVNKHRYRDSYRYHAADYLIGKMSKPDRKGHPPLLIKGGRNKFMVSEEYCTLLDRPEAWEIHIDRRKRWEWDVVKGSYRNRKGKWALILANLKSYPVFDYAILHALALDAGLVAEDEPVGSKNHKVRDHLKKWKEDGCVDEVFARLYRTTKAPADHDLEEPDAGARPACYKLGDSVYDFVRAHIDMAVKHPRTTFSMDEIVTYVRTLQPDRDEASIVQRLYSCTRELLEESSKLFVKVAAKTVVISPEARAVFDPYPNAAPLGGLESDLLNLFGRRGSTREPFWFMTCDVMAALDVEASAAQRLLSTMEEKGLVIRTEWLDPDPMPADGTTSVEIAVALPKEPLYLVTEEGYAEIGVEIVLDPYFYRIPRDDMGWPLRIPPEWQDDPIVQAVWRPRYVQCHWTIDDGARPKPADIDA